jgi:phosphotransferase family enzyme
MIEGLANLLEGSDQTGLSELRALLQQLLRCRNKRCKLIEQVGLQANDCRVYRLRFDVDGQLQSLVVKALKPNIGQRNEAVIHRWLPAVDLEESSPKLLGVAAERRGKCVWHVYQDLGPWALDARAPTHQEVKAAVDLIAKLHTRFAGHPLLAEVRLEGGDLGFSFFSANVRDALRCLQSLHPPEVELSAEHAALRNRLLERMDELLDQEPWRAQLLAEHGGPETLLHGDLWTSNAFVRPAAGSFRAWLIDWDRTAVGPVSYDLSTFLLRFPSMARGWILELYRTAVSMSGWYLPVADDLNRLFETAELARFVNMILWPAIALGRDPTGWGWERLAEIEQWFEQMQPILPSDRAGRAAELALQ